MRSCTGHQISRLTEATGRTFLHIHRALSLVPRTPSSPGPPSFISVTVVRFKGQADLNREVLELGAFESVREEIFQLFLFYVTRAIGINYMMNSVSRHAVSRKI